jgi:PKD repeat protein/predicted nucleotidyltransferase
MKVFAKQKHIITIILTFITFNLFSQTFAEQTGIVFPAVEYGSVAWGDYDNDGDLDILLTGRTNEGMQIFYSISKIFRNNGDNSFSDQVNIQLEPVSNSAVAWGDYDNDGYLDIILTGNSGSGPVSRIYRNNKDGTFTKQDKILLEGIYNGSAKWGDYDNDGDLDILLTGLNIRNGVISKIYRNHGDNIFIEQAGIILSQQRFGSWGDYDNDGDLDIFLAGTSDPKIYKNNGNNTFSELSSVFFKNTFGGPLELSDYDNDGDLDVLLTGMNSLLYLNNGNSTFTEQIGISLAGAAEGSVAWGDYDNDGYSDLLLTGNSNSIYGSRIYRNNKDNTFSEQTSILLPGIGNSSVAFGDYDNDGDLDLLMTGRNAIGVSITKLFRNEIATPNTKPELPANLNTIIDGGKVLFKWDKTTDSQNPQNGLNYNLYVYESGQNKYQCSPQAFPQSNPQNGKRLLVKAGSIQWNSSGYIFKDLPPNRNYIWSVQAVDGSFSGSEFANTVSFFMPDYKPLTQANSIRISNMEAFGATARWGNGKGTKRAVFIKPATTGTADPIDGITYSTNSSTPGGWICVYNGIADSVVIKNLLFNTEYSIHVCEYNGDPGYEKYLTTTEFLNPVFFNTVFEEQTSINMDGVYSSSMAWGDTDNDGFLDLILSGNFYNGGSNTRIYHNNGDNSFSHLSNITLSGISEGSVSWCDYDNDEKLDLFITSRNGSGEISKLYHNNGTNIFTEESNVSIPGVKNSSIAWGDCNNDGFKDLLITGNTVTGPISKIYLNNGNRTFSELSDILLVGVFYSSVAWGDYDNDGYQDILLTGQDVDMNRLSKIYRNEGNNSFSEQKDIQLPGIWGGSVAWGDYDNDGNLDILMAGSSKNGLISKIFHNNGNNSFTENTAASLPGVFYSTVAWGDYDNDGDLDVLLTGSANSFNISAIYRNNGDNTFAEHLNLPFIGVSNGSSGWMDYDNDGDLDVLLTGNSINYGPISKIYRNNSPIINNVPEKPKNLSFETNKNLTTLKWDRVTSDETSSRTLSYNAKIGRSTGKTNFLSPSSSSNGIRKIVAMGNTQLDTFLVFKVRWDTTYFVSVQAIDNSFIGGPFSDEIRIKIDPVQSSQLIGVNKGRTSLMLKWERGNGDRCIMFAKEGISGSASPQNFTTYYANPVFGEGSTIGSTGWYCIYKGAGDSVLLDGLKMQKNYTIQVVEFQGKIGSEIYATKIVPDNIGVFSTGLFTEQAGISLPSVSNGNVTWVDYDNDGDLDIFFIGSGISKIFRNNGNNSFTEQINISFLGMDYASSAWGDFDNDYDLDLIISGRDLVMNTISRIYRNNNDNTFTEISGTNLPGVWDGSLTCGDYDNDGYLDLLITGDAGPSGSSGSSGYYSGTNSISKIYHNNGDFSFSELTGVGLTPVYKSSCAMGDYDNDGNLDILITGLASSDKISKIYRNNGNNTFTEKTDIALPGISNSTALWIDYNNDGYLDIYITGGNPMILLPEPSGQISKIYRNNKNGTFTDQNDISLPGVFFSASAWGDYNNDGNLDLILTGDTGPNRISKVYRNNGNNTFTEESDIILPNITSGSVAWGDYDNDGDLDLILTGTIYSGYAISKIYTNNLIMKSGLIKPNSKPSTPVNLKSLITPGNINLNWNPVINDESPAKTISYNLRYKLKNQNRWKFAPHSAENGYRKVATFGNIQLNNNFNLKNISSGTYYWQVQAVDQSYMGGGWSEVDSFMVKNVLAYFRADTVCQGTPTKFIDESTSISGILAWKWIFDEGITSSEQNPTHLFTNSGIHSVKLFIHSTDYSDSILINVMVLPKPTATFSVDPVCHGKSTTIINSSITNGLTINSWNWDFGDGQSFSAKDPPSHFFAQPGNYKTKLTITSSNGCIDTLTKFSKVGEYPVVILSADGPTEFCNGSKVNLSVGNQTNYSYQWNLNEIPLTGAKSSTISINTSGSYSVTVTNTVANCLSSSPKTQVSVIEKPAKPIIVYNGIANGFCPSEENITFNLDQPSSSFSYQWKRNGVPIDNATRSSYTGEQKAGIYSVSASVKGCAAESNEITLTPKEAYPKPDIYVKGPVVWYMASSENKAAGYTWYRNNEIIPGANKYIYVANKTLGTYKVAITNEAGCTTFSNEVTIPVSKSEMKGFDVPAEFLPDELDPFAGLKIYPNPTPGLFTIEMDNDVFGELNISIATQAGKEILKIKFQKSTVHFLTQVDLSGQPNGMYFINLLIDKYKATRKLLVE